MRYYPSTEAIRYNTNKKQKALEEFLNDSVEEIEVDLFKWRSIYYQIMPRSTLHRRALRPDHFIKHEYQGTIYFIREMSKDLLQKYYMIKIDH